MAGAAGSGTQGTGECAFSFEGTFESGILLPLMHFVSCTPIRRQELSSSGSLGLFLLIILARVENTQDFGR